MGRSLHFSFYRKKPARQGKLALDWPLCSGIWGKRAVPSCLAPAPRVIRAGGLADRVAPAPGLIWAGGLAERVRACISELFTVPRNWLILRRARPQLSKHHNTENKSHGSCA